MTRRTKYDMIIVGAGLVGASLAVALAQKDFRIAILETHIPDAITGMKIDRRPLTLNFASYQILQNLGLWSALAEYACPIAQVNVSEQGCFGKIRFKASDYQIPALGYVVPFDKLHQTLYQTAASSALVSILNIHQLNSIQTHNQGAAVDITLPSGVTELLTAKLLVGADGSDSATRKMQGISVNQCQLNEQAFIATLTLFENHNHQAYERFTSMGTLALLPLFNSKEMRLVWALSEKNWQIVQNWTSEQLLAYLNNTFVAYLSVQRVCDERSNFKLHTSMAQEQIKPGFVLIGNSAHTLYPLAAQGFNLALSDAAALHDILVNAHHEKEDLGDLSVLTRYIDWRLPQQRVIERLTHNMNQLFGIHLVGVGGARSAALLGADICSSVKYDLGKRLMGVAGRLPSLVQGDFWL